MVGVNIQPTTVKKIASAVARLCCIRCLSGASRGCSSLTIPVHVDSDVLVPKDTKDEFGELKSNASSLRRVDATYNIYGVFCQPDAVSPRNGDVLQLLVHGITYTSQYWSPSVEEFRIIPTRPLPVTVGCPPLRAIDWPGVGLSARPVNASDVQYPTCAAALSQVARHLKTGGECSLGWPTTEVRLIFNFGMLQIIQSNLHYRLPVEYNRVHAWVRRLDLLHKCALLALDLAPRHVAPACPAVVDLDLGQRGEHAREERGGRGNDAALVQREDAHGGEAQRRPPRGGKVRGEEGPQRERAELCVGVREKVQRVGEEGVWAKFDEREAREAWRGGGVFLAGAIRRGRRREDVQQVRDERVERLELREAQRRAAGREGVRGGRHVLERADPLVAAQEARARGGADRGCPQADARERGEREPVKNRVPLVRRERDRELQVRERRRVDDDELPGVVRRAERVLHAEGLEGADRWHALAGAVVHVDARGGRLGPAAFVAARRGAPAAQCVGATCEQAVLQHDNRYGAVAGEGAHQLGQSTRDRPRLLRLRDHIGAEIELGVRKARAWGREERHHRVELGDDRGVDEEHAAGQPAEGASAQEERGAQRDEGLDGAEGLDDDMARRELVRGYPLLSEPRARRELVEAPGDLGDAVQRPAVESAEHDGDELVRERGEAAFGAFVAALRGGRGTADSRGHRRAGPGGCPFFEKRHGLER
ncbi:hypothetical protein GGX14DRAFT_395295 [Mycena pura]|uniref:Uncharacterized protein n=1 Tax=Mycena pura TaxID=153505 RepID=A0AAD6VCL8_9AGAR|nr:hypothetical protein GGX14DRAFT_395295 [Mycena pura]